MEENTELKQRLLKFIEFLGLNPYSFERKIGISEGIIRKAGRTLSKNTEEKIKAAYPELNISWLLTGEGEMLKAGDNINIRQRDNNTNNIGNTHGFKDFKDTTALNDLKAKDEMIKHLQEEINYLRKQNETLMRMLEDK